GWETGSIFGNRIVPPSPVSACANPLAPQFHPPPKEAHLAWGFVFLAESLGASLCRAAINSPWSEKALDTRPALMSASALARLASMIWRCAGVYSSSAVGNLERSITNFGVMTILPRWKAKFTRSPLKRPACRRTAVGMVTWPLFWILPVVFIENLLVNFWK